MIPFLKNWVFRIWGAGLLAFVSSLWLLTQTGAAFAHDAALLVFGILFGVAFVGLGWLSDRVVRIQFAPLIQEAEILERGGMGVEAEQAFEKALTLLDSLLISPRRRRQYLRILGARMARFYSARAEKNDQAYVWIARYLKANPADTAIAAVWLQGMDSRPQWAQTQQNLAARIGEACRGDRPTQTILARIYIRSERTDFPALQTYQRLIAAPEDTDRALIAELARLFIKEGRADELALQAYVLAAGQSAPTPDLRCGLAACLRWVQDIEGNRKRLAQARHIIGAIETDELERMSSGFVPPTGSFKPAAGSGRSGLGLRAAVNRALDSFRIMGRSLAGGVRMVTAGLQTPYWRKVAKTALIAGLALSAVAMIFSTAGHLVKTPPPAPASNTVVKSAPAPYTLQVAAYLKPEHADRFIKILKTKGQEAYRVQVQRRDKTWYQVRVGRFRTKDSARAHGHLLKTEGVIEDFYVANYQALQFDKR